MKAVEKNISRHENGVLYFVARRGGRLTWRSLRTKNLEEARRIVREQGVQGLISAREPAVPLPMGIAKKRVVMGVAEALDEHDRGLVLLSHGAREMAARGRRAVEKYCRGWEVFSAVEIWNGYRQSGMQRNGRELTSACNHLRWYLNKVVPWAVAKELISATAKEELARLPKIKIPPRRIRVPEPVQVDEFLKMVATEDSQGAAFLRFLAATGLRRGGACELTWRQIDFANGTMEVRQKGGRVKVIPMGPEALEILRERQQLARPWPYGIKELEVLERRMKRFAKGFGLDLMTFHCYRHYFASRALMSGLTVQEVADMLGHSDGGVLVLQTYGHICGVHLKTAVAGLRLTS